MQFLTDQSYIYNVYTSEMQKIKAGPFLQKMFTEMLEKRNDKLKPQERKMFIYTGHDTTVVNILSSLKIWKRQLPRYSIMTIFELHKNKDNGEYYVEVSYLLIVEHSAAESSLMRSPEILGLLSKSCQSANREADSTRL